MTSAQRYISKELTHFIGRRSFIPGEEKPATDDERYNMLLTYLREGIITFFPHEDKSATPKLLTRFNSELSSNKLFSSDVICFCDIPFGDLGIHMKKYSKFGISFLKSFLILKGASPVLYVANNALTAHAENPKRREDYFNEKMEIFKRLYVNALSKADKDVLTPEDAEWHKLWDLCHFFSQYIFSFLKLFDDTKLDDDENNYYMEREWRVIGNVYFQLGDVYRVIIPREYAKRLRKDLPEYMGQISFAYAE